jgi:RNA polymerase sigma-70 factor (ECF subfamily)
MPGNPFTGWIYSSRSWYSVGLPDSFVVWEPKDPGVSAGSWIPFAQRQIGSMQNPRSTPGDVTVLLQKARGGDEAALDRVLPLIYEELRRLARRKIRSEARGHTLHATELVHEAYLKLADQSRVAWAGKTHFFAVAATAMRRILVDHARRRSRLKRGGHDQTVTLHDDMGLFPPAGLDPEDVIVLDEALVALGEHDERQAKIVEMRVFSGLTVEEVAAVLGVSRRTVEGEWTHAKAWLRRRMADGEAP